MNSTYYMLYIKIEKVYNLLYKNFFSKKFIFTETKID